MNRFIILNENNIIMGIRYAQSIVDGEIESVIGEIGQIMQSDGTFIDEPIEPTEPQITLEDKINLLYYKSLGVL